MSENPNITVEFLRNNKGKTWCWTTVSNNPTISYDIIKNNTDLPWCWRGFSRNPCVNSLFIKSNPHIKWDWNTISSNKDITEDIIEENIDKPWNWRELNKNQNISWKFVKKYKNKDWHWFILLDNYHCINWNNIKDDIIEYWELFALSRHPEIVLNMYTINRHNIDVHHKIQFIYEHPCFDWALVKNNRDLYWNWKVLSMANMKETKLKYIENKTRDHFNTQVLGELDEYFLRPDNLKKGVYIEEVEVTIQYLHLLSS